MNPSAHSRFQPVRVLQLKLLTYLSIKRYTTYGCAQANFGLIMHSLIRISAIFYVQQARLTMRKRLRHHITDSLPGSRDLFQAYHLDIGVELVGSLSMVSTAMNNIFYGTLRTTKTTLTAGTIFPRSRIQA